MSLVGPPSVRRGAAKNLPRRNCGYAGLESPTFALRMGLRYVRGLREEAAQSLFRERTARSLHFHPRSHPPRSRTAQRRTHYAGGNRRAERNRRKSRHVMPDDPERLQLRRISDRHSIRQSQLRRDDSIRLRARNRNSDFTAATPSGKSNAPCAAPGPLLEQHAGARFAFAARSP